jgi:lantibiotic biosynthesis protein
VARNVDRREAALTLSAWSPVLSPALRGGALAAGREVAARSTDRARIAAAIAAAREQTRFPRSIHWDPASLAQGDAGLALVCAYLDRCFPDADWDVAGHGFLAAAAAQAERSRPGPSLFGGLAGLGLAACALSRGVTRYARLSSTLDGALAGETFALDFARDGMPVSHFDAISGLSGIGAYLLLRRGRPDVDAALERLLEALVALTHSTGRPRWFTPPALMYDETTAAMYPDGHLNCGLAHGIPGPLALMALARVEGVEIPGMRDAIASVAAWLAEHRVDDAWGVNWPTMVGLGPRPDEPSRAAWCYGSPGVARALWLAGDALDDAQLRSLAIEAMRAVYDRPVAQRQIDSPTFCHGVAGLLQITLRFAHDTGAAVFADAAAELTEQLLAAYDPDSLLGFRSLEPAGNAVDQAGLLDGAPGVALALLAAATDAEPTWDRLFLLA